MSGTSVICLLAGKSTRMGAPKQAVRIGNATFLEHICDRLAQCPTLDQRVFVGSAHDTPSQEAIARVKGTWVVNHDIDKGPLHSIRLALEKIPLDSGFLLWPIDHPLIQKKTIENLLEKAAAHPDLFIIPCFEGRRGHPPRFPSWARPELFQGPLEEGARWVLQRHPDRIFHLECVDPWVTRNLNSPDMLEEARKLLENSRPPFADRFDK